VIYNCCCCAREEAKGERTIPNFIQSGKRLAVAIWMCRIRRDRLFLPFARAILNIDSSNKTFCTACFESILENHGECRSNNNQQQHALLYHCGKCIGRKGRGNPPVKRFRQCIRSLFSENGPTMVHFSISRRPCHSFGLHG
jgi:hypothetical protein